MGKNLNEFMTAAGIRAVRTFAQTLIALIPAGATIEAVDWRVVLSTALLSCILSFFTCVAFGIPESKEDESNV